MFLSFIHRYITHKRKPSVPENSRDEKAYFRGTTLVHPTGPGKLFWFLYPHPTKCTHSFYNGNSRFRLLEVQRKNSEVSSQFTFLPRTDRQFSEYDTLLLFLFHDFCNILIHYKYVIKISQGIFTGTMPIPLSLSIFSKLRQLCDSGYADINFGYFIPCTVVDFPRLRQLKHFLKFSDRFRRF